MFSHVTLGSNNLIQSKKFYDAVLGVIGVRPSVIFKFNTERLIYVHPRGLLAVVKPLNGQPATFANGGTTGFTMNSTSDVDAFHTAALTNGGTCCEDPPGVRDTPAGKSYLAYVRDPDGNKLCCVYRLAN